MALVEEECSSLYRAYKVTASVFSILIMASFTVFVFYISFYNWSLYSLHPAFFTLGSLLLMAEAIIVLSPDNFFAVLQMNHEQAMRQHWILNAGAAVSIVIGLASIIIHKDDYNDEHFVSWHAITGLISVILFAISCFGGIATLYSDILTKWITPAKIKCYHVCIGILTFVMGIVAEGFGIYTHWFLYYTSTGAEIVCVLLITLASVLALQEAIVSAYFRLKQVYS